MEFGMQQPKEQQTDEAMPSYMPQDMPPAMMDQPFQAAEAAPAIPQTDAPNPMDVLAANQHPLTQPQEAAHQPAEPAPEAAAFEQPELAPTPAAADAGTSLAERVASLEADYHAMEEENAKLRAENESLRNQFGEMDDLRAKESLLNDATDKLQALVNQMRG